ncbi:class I SAM-dependent methyltransferase [Pseudomonas sp. LRF_L74]|uniref:class I SAM-dependent methyltransferase n=1 Tax=Pseudomonas sp. LRF_L74 TaxID=3369422 RepID=UPI003F632CCB
MLKRPLLLALIAGFSLPLFAATPDGSVHFNADQYATVLAGDWRAPENRARDNARHPRETLTFFGLAPGQTVVEITPGNGWYSELLAPLLKPQGQYIAAIKTPDTPYDKQAGESLRAKFAADASRYGKARLIEFDEAAPILGQPASADLVLTFRNVHNWTVTNHAPAMFSAFYKVLKPGGTLGVVDHRAAPGSRFEAVQESGYLPTDYVIKLATDAGFILAGSSEINANPKDTKDHPEGVWTLPPALRLGDKDKQKYLAIGESDRMTLRFVKPAQSK